MSEDGAPAVPEPAALKPAAAEAANGPADSEITGAGPAAPVANGDGGAETAAAEEIVAKAKNFAHSGDAAQSHAA